MVEILDSRAHWQRTEGMVLFDHAFREVFPQLLAGVNVVSLARYYKKPAEYDPMEIAQVAGDHVVDLFKDDNSKQSIYLLPRPIRNSVIDFTHAGYHVALKEAVESTVHFPLNILQLAESERPEAHASLTSNLQSISTVFQKPFFSRLCETAAFTMNGIWQGFSSSQATPGSYPVRILDKSSANFAYYATSTGTEFDFTPAVKRRLLNELRNQNRFARERGLDVMDDDKNGSTSGCPVARTQPRYTDHAHDKVRLKIIAEYLETSPEEITAPRSESAIAFGLQQFGKLLERVIDESDRLS